jgi:hypothetical protein
MSRGENGTERRQSQRRGFLRTLGGLAAAGGAAAATTAAAQRADSVPAGQVRKENEPQRFAARYRADAPDVQAFYRTNRYEN